MVANDQTLNGCRIPLIYIGHSTWLITVGKGREELTHIQTFPFPSIDIHLPLHCVCCNHILLTYSRTSINSDHFLYYHRSSVFCIVLRVYLTQPGRDVRHTHLAHTTSLNGRGSGIIPIVDLCRLPAT